MKNDWTLWLDQKRKQPLVTDQWLRLHDARENLIIALARRRPDNSATACKHLSSTMVNF